MRRRIGKRAGHRKAVLQGRRDVLADRPRATQRRACLALLLGGIDPRLDRGLVPAERELKSGRGHRRPSHAVRLIGNRAGGQRARLEVRRRKRGLAIVDAGLAAPIGGGRHARKRIHSLVLALILQRRRKVERLVAGETERSVGRCRHLPARDAREQEERAGEVTYCSFFDFAASKRFRLMAKRSSTKPAANARITINRIVSTPMRTPPTCSNCDIRTGKSPSNVIEQKYSPSVAKIPQHDCSVRNIETGMPS